MTWQIDRRSEQTLVICSVDTEEDNWEPSREDVKVTNVREVPRLADLMGELQAPVTWFVTHAVVADSGAGRVLRGVVERGHGEIGAHLHPWNTPPQNERMEPRNYMLNNLPASLQFSKLRRLTDRLEDVFGRPPVSFRAGRSALGSGTIDVLRRCGYTIDSSVMPYYDLRAAHGPTFLGAPNQAYCIGEKGDVLAPLDSGPILEIPVSSGYSRVPFDLWSGIHRRLASPIGRAVKLPGIASRTGLIRKISLKPELETVSDMLDLAGKLIALGTAHLQIMWHSPSLLPGTSPFVRTIEERDRLLARIRGFVSGLRQAADVEFVTMSDAADRLARQGPEKPIAPTRPG